MPFEMARKRVSVPVITFLVVVVGGGWYWRNAIFSASERVDEATYSHAGRLATGGANPYEETGFLYTPAFALLWSMGEQSLGQRAFLIAYRWASLVGFWLLVWAALEANPWPWPIQGLFCIALLGSPIFLNAFLCGNVTLVVLGPLAWALLVAERAPLRSGVVLGTINALKPLGAVALAVLVTPGKTLPCSRWALKVVLSAALSLGLWLLLGYEHLPRMWKLLRGRPEEPFNISLHRVLLAAGLEIPAPLLFLLVAGATIWIARGLPDDPRKRLVLAGAGTLLAMPVNNPHTFLLTLPIQVLALERAVGAWQGPGRSGHSLLRRPWIQVALVMAAIFGVNTATGAVSAADLPLEAQALVIAIPLLAVVGLTWFTLAGEKETTLECQRSAT